MQLWLTRHREVRWGGRWLQRPVLHALSPPRISAAAAMDSFVLFGPTSCRQHQLQVYTAHLPAVCSGASLVLCKLSGPAPKYSPIFQGYTSERHCIHFSGGPGGTEPPLPKAANSSAHLPIFLFPTPPLHSSSSASRNQLPNKVCGPKSLFWALIWEQLKLK